MLHSANKKIHLFIIKTNPTSTYNYATLPPCVYGGPSDSGEGKEREVRKEEAAAGAKRGTIGDANVAARGSSKPVDIYSFRRLIARWTEKLFTITTFLSSLSLIALSLSLPSSRNRIYHGFGFGWRFRGSRRSDWLGFGMGGKSTRGGEGREGRGYLIRKGRCLWRVRRGCDT